MQPSTCSGLLAVDHANTKKNKGLRATGVGAAICARHEFFLPNGMGDLQKGERYVQLHSSVNLIVMQSLARYCNMDFIFASSLCNTSLKKVTVSYDIACQWSVKLENRLKLLPENLRSTVNNIDIEFAVPKLHINSHKSSCHTKFGLNYRPGVGRTDGEGVERRWSEANNASTSTKEMCEGHRHDVLDDVCNDSNYRKTIGIGEVTFCLSQLPTQGTVTGLSLSRKLEVARHERELHEKEFELFSQSIAASTRDEWLAMVLLWESDSTKPNPYCIEAECTFTFGEHLFLT